IDVEDAGDNFAILDCEFGYAETATDEFSATIVISGADDGRIERCKFDSGAQAAVTAISFENVTGLLIKDNKIFGDYSTAIIHHPSTNLPSNEVFI
ncbi:MAG: hypothetical protein GWN55_10515, partial [Phycisphaerae bacterium]|nr:hypothetical protein [Phycisphaerae bacterium]NIV01734.1 hypothetical protein [Phycisphaerae bacterium]NIX00632.1 hypothetical protein [Phycisphaerae bacterium]